MAKRNTTSQGQRFADELFDASAENESKDSAGRPPASVTPLSSEAVSSLVNGSRPKHADAPQRQVGMDLGNITAEEFIDRIDGLQAQLDSLKLSVAKANPGVSDQAQIRDPGSSLVDPSPADIQSEGAANVNGPRKIVFSLGITAGGCQTSVSAGLPLAASGASSHPALDVISGDVTVKSTARRRRRNDSVMTDLLRDFLQSKRIMAVQYKGEAAEGTLPDCASPSDISNFLANYPKRHPKHHPGPDPTNILYDWRDSLTRRTSKWNLQATDLLANEFYNKLKAGKLFFSDGEPALFDPALHTVEDLRVLIPSRLRQTQNWWKKADSIRQAEALRG